MGVCAERHSGSVSKRRVDIDFIALFTVFFIAQTHQQVMFVFGEPGDYFTIFFLADLAYLNGFQLAGPGIQGFFANHFKAEGFVAVFFEHRVAELLLAGGEIQPGL